MGNLLGHKGEEHLFFWRSVAPGMDDRAKEILGAFPMNEQARKVLTWLNGGARQYTLFDPASQNELPPGLEASSRVVREGGVQRLLVRLTSRGHEPLAVATEADFCTPWTDTRVIGPEGEVVWPGQRIIVTNAPGFPPKLVTLAPGESMDFSACRFAVAGQGLGAAGAGALRLAKGKHRFRFVYDSTHRDTHNVRPTLKARIVVYGTFEVEP
jgi:hypothetical protein